MPPAGVSFEHDDRLRSRSDIRPEDPRSIDPRFVQRAPVRGRATSPQPSPNPIAVEVAERYAKALTLGATAPAAARPEPRRPRRSQAAMRDRALDSSGRSTARRRTRGASSASERPSRPATSSAPAQRPPRPRTPAPGDADRATALALRIPPSDEPARAPGRRTVTIRGRGAERDYGWTNHSSRRPSVPAYERPGFKPDRAALWAVLLGLLLVLVAATSAHAAVLAHAVH